HASAPPESSCATDTSFQQTHRPSSPASRPRIPKRKRSSGGTTPSRLRVTSATAFPVPGDLGIHPALVKSCLLNSELRWIHVHAYRGTRQELGDLGNCVLGDIHQVAGTKMCIFTKLRLLQHLFQVEQPRLDQVVVYSPEQHHLRMLRLRGQSPRNLHRL